MVLKLRKSRAVSAARVVQARLSVARDDELALGPRIFESDELVRLARLVPAPEI